MPTQTFSLPAPPTIPTGKEIYDSIMSRIEPELVSRSVSLLQEKYKNENPAQKEERKNRYNRAFVEYGKHYKKFLADLEEELHHYQREAMRSVEAWSRAQEQRKLDTLFL